MPHRYCGVLAGAAVLVASGSCTVALGFTSAPAAASSAPTCSTVSVKLLDAELGIASVAVHTVHPSAKATTVLCSYYGASGGYENQATIAYLRATPAQFADVIGGVRKAHKLVEVPHLGDGAYTYSLAPNTYLYMLDGATLVQVYAAVGLARLEALARKMVPLVRTP